MRLHSSANGVMQMASVMNYFLSDLTDAQFVCFVASLPVVTVGAIIAIGHELTRHLP